MVVPGLDGPMVSNPSESHQANIIACSAISWGIATVFVAVRFYTRWKIVYVLGVEDWILLVALIFSGLNTSTTIRQAYFGLGKHQGDIPFQHMAPMLQANWMSMLWYNLSMNAVEVSILLLYIRILTYHYIRYAAYTMLVFVLALTVWYLVSIFTVCIPLQSYWDFTVQSTFCWPQSVFWLNIGLHMFTDFVVVLLPMPVIFRLRIRWQQKLLLYCLFAFGFFICIAALMRMLAYVWNLSRTDLSYNSNDISYWTTIEPNTGIVCACVMTLKPLLTRFVPALAENGRLGGELNEPQHNNKKKRRRANDVQDRPLTIGSKPIRKPPGRLSQTLARFGGHDRMDSLQSPSERAMLESRGHDGLSDDAQSVHLHDLEAALTREERERKMYLNWDEIREETKEPSISWPFRPPRAKLRAANLRRQSNETRKAARDRASSQTVEPREPPAAERSFYNP